MERSDWIAAAIVMLFATGLSLAIGAADKSQKEKRAVWCRIYGEAYPKLDPAERYSFELRCKEPRP